MFALPYREPGHRAGVTYSEQKTSSVTPSSVRFLRYWHISGCMPLIGIGIRRQNGRAEDPAVGVNEVTYNRNLPLYGME